MHPLQCPAVFSVVTVRCCWRTVFASLLFTVRCYYLHPAYHCGGAPSDHLLHTDTESPIGCLDSFDTGTNSSSPANILAKLVEYPRNNNAMKFYNGTGYVEAHHGPNGLQDITGRVLALIAGKHLELQKAGYKATEKTVLNTFTVDMSSSGMNAAQVQNDAGSRKRAVRPKLAKTLISPPLVLHKFRSTCQNMSRALMNSPRRENPPLRSGSISVWKSVPRRLLHKLPRTTRSMN